MLSQEEKHTFGWIGRPPQEVIDGPPEITRRWKELASRARRVAKMRHSAQKVELAKKVEADYHLLVEWARNTAADRRSDG